MLTLVSEAIEQYARENTTPLPELLQELSKATYAKTDLPQMQSGPLAGQFLKTMARVSGASRILEVGTFTGFSALMMAMGMAEGGHITTLEYSEDNAAIAREFFDKSPYKDQIEIKLGPAADTLKTLSGPFDMAFIDADKVNYINYFDAILPKMRPGGLILIDNVLWSGKVLAPESEQEESTKAIAAFNAHLRNLEHLDKVMVTLRDGITMVVAP
ncbi:O-methyltransferase [Acanthopleuribacter pedis]|uniref:Class I SAM-dependent methyltransferase n=1 Tax=Acanthopleuribacter pedis TaxID=442870 RepID=A0A8J7U1R0_9BACT|nr:O-methyltransferase [Acanthopleuribacter pedis]MBO1318468.1 class I SAM-dependent methyltransferase [Acanthopleuribacter pedis]